MELLLSRFRNLTVLLLVIFAQLILLAYQVKGNQEVRLIRVWAVTAVTPIAKLLEVVRQNTVGVVEDYFVLINVRDQNRQLQQEVGRLKMDNQFLRTELNTADRARALQAFQSRTPSRTIPARIIGTGTGANARVVFIDQGSGRGVMRGMAVVTPDGIVGKVLASYPTAAQVLLITDPSFAAGVISQKNRIHGTLKGIGQNKCIIDYVENEEKVEVGETFFTSGDDRVFPKGLPAGKVTVVRAGRTFKEIYVTPNGFQNGLEEVLVVIEGVHQVIPDPATASPELSLMAPPPSATSGDAPAGVDESVQTEADRIRDRYKRIGVIERHVYGEGAPGSKPPDFNIDPDATPTPEAAKPPAAAPSTSGRAPQGTVPVPAPPKPSTDQPGLQPATRQPSATSGPQQSRPSPVQP
jgi:rod shape-determining protein MreC